MFAAPTPDQIRDVEAQQAQPSAPQYSYSDSGPKMMTTTTTTTGGGPVTQPQRPMSGQAQEQPTVQKSTITRLATSLDWGTHIFLLAFFSLLVMITTANLCNSLPQGQCTATRGYQVAVGTISLIVALIVGLVYWANALENHVAQIWISVSFFLWWAAGVVVLTYFGDFTTTSNANGYFATWASFVISAFSLVAISPRFENRIDQSVHSIRKPIFFLLIASLVVMGAAIGPCSPSANCQSYSAYALVVSVVSLFFAIVIFFMVEKIERKTLKMLSALFVIWWVFGAAVLTLGGPFQQPGNGYFGCFAALFASVALLRTLHKEGY